MTQPFDNPVPQVSRGAMTLGLAGLLPQFAAVTFAALGERQLAPIVATVYPLVILSFLGGIWWGFAMRRTTDQTQLATIAVCPSLVAMAVLMGIAWSARMDWALVTTGIAILLTLLVDRHLVATGEAPAGWMQLRVPLSVGLGGLTIVAGYLLR